MKKEETDTKKEDPNKSVKIETKKNENTTTVTPKDGDTKKEPIEKSETVDEKSDCTKTENLESVDLDDTSNTDIIKTENMDIDDKE